MKTISRTFVLFCFMSMGACASAGDAIPGKPAEDHLRVVTYNVLKGTPVATIADTLRPYRADVILLQEVDQGTRRARAEDQPAELKRLLGMHAFYAPSYKVDGGTTGEMILSRLPLSRTGVLTLPKSRSIGALAATRWRGQKLLVISAHLSATFKADVDHVRDSAAARVREAKRIAAVASKSDRLVIVGGDFNCSPGAAPFKRIAEVLEPVAPGASLPARFPLLAFDYFFLDKSLVRGRSFVGPRSDSDHRAVVVDISPPPPLKGGTGEAATGGLLPVGE